MGRGKRGPRPDPDAKPKEPEAPVEPAPFDPALPYDSLGDEQRLLPVPLSDPEKLEAAVKADEAFRTWKVHDAELKATTKSLRGIADEAWAEFERRQEIIHSGREEREVSCEKRYDHGTKIVTICRTDLPPGHDAFVVERRPISDDELQGRLPLQADAATEAILAGANVDVGEEPPPYECPNCGSAHLRENCPVVAAVSE